MSTPSFIATLTNKVVSGNAAQLGMTRQNTTNPVESTSSFDTYGRPSALSTNFRETAGMDPNYRMCTETAVSRPQYSYYLNPSLGLNNEEGASDYYETMSGADVMTGRVLGRANQHGDQSVQNKTTATAGATNNTDIPFDEMLLKTRKRFDAVA